MQYFIGGNYKYLEAEFRDGDITIVNPHIKPDHGDYIVLKIAKDKAVRNISLFTFHASRFFRIIGKDVEKEKRH